MVSENCIEIFLHHFRYIHDWIEQRYLSKYLIVVGGEGGFTDNYINALFREHVMVEGIT